MSHSPTHRESTTETMARLKADLDRTWQENLEARAQFDAVIGDSPGTIPYPDGSLRIHQAGTAMNLALKNYITALKRFSDFAIRGTIPDDPDSD